MSAAPLHKNLHHSSSPIKAQEDTPKLIHKQGLVSILGSDPPGTKPDPSFRRTLSADMSSKQWLSQNGFFPMKKNMSCEQFPIISSSDSSSSSDEEEESERPTQDDVWSSILTQKNDGSNSKLPPPYVHPLVKRSSSLSEKSLEICTESLGSETGSDGFSSYPNSEIGDVVDDHEKMVEIQSQEKEYCSKPVDKVEEIQVVKCNYSSGKKLLPPRSFPPPLPSLTRPDGASVHVQSCREQGRLVLKAVSVPSKNFFLASRQDGRLRLTFVNSLPSEESRHQDVVDGKERFEKEVEAEANEEDDEEEDEEMINDLDTDEQGFVHAIEEEKEEMVERGSGGKGLGIVMEKAPKLSSGVIDVHRSALIMKKLMGYNNRIPNWHKFNKAVKLVEEVEMEEEEMETTLSCSLSSSPRLAHLIPSSVAATNFNTYEYFWRGKPPVATMTSPITQQSPLLKNNYNQVILSNTSPKAYNQRQEVVLLRGNKKDYLVPLLRRGCKETRRSLLIWEPYCIATS